MPLFKLENIQITLEVSLVISEGHMDTEVFRAEETMGSAEVQVIFPITVKRSR